MFEELYDNIEVVDASQSNWQEKILQLIGPKESHTTGPLKAILALTQNMGVKTIVLESNYVDSDFLDEFRTCYSRSFRNYSTLCKRIHFFKDAFTKEKLPTLNLVEQGYLGLSLVRPIGSFCTGRTILVSPKHNGDTTFTLCRVKFEANLSGNKLDVYGMPYIQQDTNVGVCAQAAMWMTSLYMHYKFGSPRFRPSEITAAATKSITIGPIRRGLVPEQIISALREMGYAPVIFTHYDPLIRENFDPECGTLTIGPAGENLLPFACVGSDFFRKAGRGGAGAVMGSKNLKAIAIKGTGGISCADMGAFHRLILNHQKRVRQRFMTPMTITITNAAGMLPTRNFTQGQFKKGTGTIDKDAVIDVKIADRACYACFAGCANITQVKDGIFKDLLLEGPEYETLAMLGANLGIDYLPAIMKANYLCDDLGMDTISAGVAIGFAMECYERGILTQEKTGGLELKFGNYRAMIKLLELMAYRRDFGDFCAQGVREMARLLGQHTEDFAMHSKGLEFPAYDPRAGWGSAITYSVTPRGACHRRAWPPLVEILRGVNPFSIEGKAEIVRDLMNQRCIMHSLIVCDMPGSIIRLGMDDWAQYLNIVVGSSYTGNDLNRRTEIIETLIRRINIREGFSSKDDILPKRTLEQSLPDGPGVGKIIGMENFLKMRSNYYLCRGWDSEGEPTQETIIKYEYNNEPSIEI